MTTTDLTIGTADVLSLPLESDAVDLVFCSPPYEDARTYGIDCRVRGDAWVEWAADGFMECLRVCRGLVAWVVEGRTRGFAYSATPARLMVKLQDRGVFLRKPPAYHRVGIPGSGGPDWLRNDYEFVVCATRERGRLPWSDNVACGKPPKFPPGGAPSHRRRDGSRVGESNRQNRRPNGKVERQTYSPPKLANPGNVIRCSVGKGHMGHILAHENEAPFPLPLAEFFVQSFCPPGGTVLDPFCGSGTTAHAAIANGRRAIAYDLRPCQVDLTKRRVLDVQAGGGA